MKKFFSLVLALVMALSLTTAAWGAEAINTQEALDAAVANGGEITLAAGEYTFPKITAKCTITCEEGVVFKGQSSPAIAGSTVIGATFSNPGGTAVRGTVNGIFKNCTFDGGNALRWCYAGETVEFYNCVFTADTYGVHFDGGEYDAYFEGCTFSGFNAMGSALTMLTMKDCTFKTNGRSGYNGINLWGSTEMTNCKFVFDGSVTEWVDLCGDNKTGTFTGCVVTDGTTATPFVEVVGDYGEGNSIAIDPVKDANDKYTGGTFNTDPAANVAEGYAVKNTGTAFEVYKLENKDAATTTTTTSGNTTTVEDVVIDSTAPSTIIDVTTDEETTEVVLDASAAAEVFPTTNAKPVEIVTTEASVTFDEDAAETIGTNANGAAVSLEVEVEVAPEATDVETANTAAYNEVMANADADNAVLLSIELTDASGDPLFSETNAAGTATVKVALPAGLNTAKLYYLDGADAEYLGEYTADANGYIYVELEHFSQYVIVGGTRTVVSGNTGNANGSYSSSTVNGTTTTASVADKYVIYPAGATNVLTNVNTGAFVVKSYTALSTWTVVSNGVTTQSYIPAYYTLTDGTKLYEADENCGEYRLFKDGVFVTYLNDLNGAIGSGNYVDGDFIADAATYVAKSKGCDTYNVDVYMLNGKVPTMVNKDGWNVAVINGKVAVYSNLPAGSYTAHTFTNEVTYKSTTDLTVVAIECDKCEKSFQVVKTSKLPATYKGATAPLFFGGNNYYILLESAAVSGNTGVVGGTTGGKVESAATFDAGIAMYVGMSVMAAAGSAVVIGKKRED